MVLLIKLLIGCLFFDEQAGCHQPHHLSFWGALWFSSWILSKVFSRKNYVQQASSTLFALLGFLFLGTGESFMKPEWSFNQDFKWPFFEEIAVGYRIVNLSISSVCWSLCFQPEVLVQGLSPFSWAPGWFPDLYCSSQLSCRGFWGHCLL